MSVKLRSLNECRSKFCFFPERVNIHSLDPAYIATTISYTRYNQEINLRKIINETKYKEQGIGGIETRGLYIGGIQIRFEKLSFL